MRRSLGPDDVLVKLDVATICGSDLHTINGTRKEPTPLVLGHEGVGFIEAYGSTSDKPPHQQQQQTHHHLHHSASSLPIGSRVTWSLASSCGLCPACVHYSIPQKCDSVFKYGHAPTSSGLGLNGTYSTHIVLRPGTFIATLPDNVPSRVASPANCALSTIVGALTPERMQAVRPDADRSLLTLRPSSSLLNPKPHPPARTALVQGAGLLGIYAVMYLKHHYGFDRVICSDTHPVRLAIAKAFGAIPLLVDPTSSSTSPSSSSSSTSSSSSLSSSPSYSSSSSSSSLSSTHIPSTISVPKVPPIALSATTPEQRREFVRFFFHVFFSCFFVYLSVFFSLSLSFTHSHSFCLRTNDQNAHTHTRAHPHSAHAALTSHSRASPVYLYQLTFLLLFVFANYRSLFLRRLCFLYASFFASPPLSFYCILHNNHTADPLLRAVRRRRRR